MKKKWIVYGDFYCWNCGERIIQRRRKCPFCSVWYSGKRKYQSPDLIKKVVPDPEDGSFRRHKRSELAMFLAWTVGFFLLLSGIIWLEDLSCNITFRGGKYLHAGEKHNVEGSAAVKIWADPDTPETVTEGTVDVIYTGEGAPL